YELSEVMKFIEIANEGTSSFKKYTNSGEASGKFTIQKWLLTEMVNPITLEKIQFQYESYEIDLITQKLPSYQFNDGQSAQAIQVYEQRTKGQAKRIRFIHFPDGHKLEFVYQPGGSWNRKDVPNDNPLIQV